MTATIHHLPAAPDPEQSARLFAARHAGEHLQRDYRLLIQRTAAHLQQTFELSAETANEEACRAVAEQMAAGCEAYIDIDNSTAYCVLVRIPGRGRTFVISLGELLEAAGS